MSEIRTKICSTCGKLFSYEIGKGKDRIYCGDRSCYNLRKIKQREERNKKYPKCSTSWCNKPATRVKYGLCENCYYRIKRTGKIEKRKPKYKYITADGYIKLYYPKHVLADKCGYVYEHRKVLFDLYGNGQQNCFWCGIELKWKRYCY